MPSKQQFNIGEVSQQTGVAAVTLRAWERRYGLIKPERTPKGHRLYSQANINDIKQVLNWLSRGVAISKVPALLTSNEVIIAQQDVDQHWIQIQQQLFQDITNISQTRANQLIDRLNKSTPFISLCELVYQPLNSTLEERWRTKPLGFQLEQQCWLQCWQRQSMIMTLRAEKQKAIAQCWLVNVAPKQANLDYWLWQSWLLQRGVRVNALNCAQDISALGRLDQQKASSLILYGEQRLTKMNINQIAKLKKVWRGELLCVGSMVDIHDELLSELHIDRINGRCNQCWQSEVLQSWLKQVEQHG